MSDKEILPNNFLPLSDRALFFHAKEQYASGDIVDIFYEGENKPLLRQEMWLVSGVFPSGEANFYDLDQTLFTQTFVGYRYSFQTIRGQNPYPTGDVNSNYLGLGWSVSSGIVESGIKDTYSSGVIPQKYVHYAAHPSGGIEGEDGEPFPSEVTFDPNNEVVIYVPVNPTPEPPPDDQTTTTPEPSEPPPGTPGL